MGLKSCRYCNLRIKEGDSYFINEGIIAHSGCLDEFLIIQKRAQGNARLC